MGTGSYFDRALTNTNADLIGSMRSEMKGTKYDTIVGTGLSGTIFTARVAPGLHKSFAIVRKPDDKSTHSGVKVEGVVGKRWVFADDFVSGGTTLKRVLTRMQKDYPDAVFVGVYQYERGEFCTPDEAAYRWGNWVTELSIGALYGPETLAQVQEARPWDIKPLTAPVEGWHRSLRKFLPIASRSFLTVDYPDGYGRPTLYDGANRTKWTCEDEKALPYIEEVENAAAALGVSVRRMVGERVSRLPKPRNTMEFKPLLTRMREPVRQGVEGLQAFNDAIQKADEAAMDLMKRVESRPFSA